MRKICFLHLVFILLAGMSLSIASPNDGMAAVQSEAAHHQTGADPPQETDTGMFSTEIYRVTDEDDDETRLMKEQVNCLQAEYESLRTRAEAGLDSSVFLLEALSRLADARLEFHREPEEQRHVLTEQLEIARKIEDSAIRRGVSGLSRLEEQYRTTSFRIKAELALLRFDKAQAKKSENSQFETRAVEKVPVHVEVGIACFDHGQRTNNYELRRRSIIGFGRNQPSGCRCP